MNTVAAAINGNALHALPPSTRVWQRQLLLPWESRRVHMLLAVTACLCLFHRIENPDAVQPPVLRAFEMLIFLAPAWALLLWSDERHLARRYHWSMPVDAATHDLARVFAGSVWLLAASAVFCISGMFLRGAAPSGAAAPALFWVQCFTTPQIVYLFASIITVRTERSLEWMIGAAAIAGSIGYLLESPVRKYVAFLAPLFERGAGLQTALFAGHDVFFDAVHYQLWVAEVDRPVAYQLQNLASTGQTIVSISLFTGIAVLLLVMSAHRRRRRL